MTLLPLLGVWGEDGALLDLLLLCLSWVGPSRLHLPSGYRS